MHVVKRKSKLSQLVADSPFTQSWIAVQIGYTPASWRQVVAGFRAMPEEKRVMLSGILGVPLATVRRAADATFRNEHKAPARA